MKYSKYLSSKHWEETRLKKLEETDKCEVCGSKKQIQVHHLTYERVGAELMEDLRVLCNKCHFLEHKNKLTKMSRKKIEKGKVDLKATALDLGGFIFLQFKTSQPLFDLKPADITRVIFLATFMNYDGYLSSGWHKMTMDEAYERCRMSKMRFKEFFNTVSEKGIFTVDEIGIKVSDKYFSKGHANLSSKYTRIYTYTIRDLYEMEYVFSHKRLGMYFQLIPYVHRQSNILCANPEEHFENIKKFKIRDLQRIFGTSLRATEDFLNAALSAQLDNGAPILSFNRKSWDEICFNPDVFYGGNFSEGGGRDFMIENMKIMADSH